MSTNRFDPSTVVELYRRRNMTPIRDQYLDSNRCGCLLSALYATDEELDGSPDELYDGDLLMYRGRQDGKSEQYINGLVRGFDDNRPENLATDSEFEMGFEDGRQAFENLLSANLISRV